MLKARGRDTTSAGSYCAETVPPAASREPKMCYFISGSCMSILLFFLTGFLYSPPRTTLRTLPSENQRCRFPRHTQHNTAGEALAAVGGAGPRQQGGIHNSGGECPRQQGGIHNSGGGVSPTMGVSPTAGDSSPQRGTPERSRQIWVHEGAPSGRGEPVRMFSQVITDPVAIPIQIPPVGFIPFVLALVRKREG